MMRRGSRFEARLLAGERGQMSGVMGFALERAAPPTWFERSTTWLLGVRQAENMGEHPHQCIRQAILVRNVHDRGMHERLKLGLHVHPCCGLASPTTGGAKPMLLAIAKAHRWMGERAL